VDDFAALGISFFLFPQHRQPNRVKSTLHLESDDAVASSSNAARDNALRQFKDAGAQVETSEEFITSLGGEKSGE